MIVNVFLPKNSRSETEFQIPRLIISLCIFSLSIISHFKHTVLLFNWRTAEHSYVKQIYYYFFSNSEKKERSTKIGSSNQLPTLSLHKQAHTHNTLTYTHDGCLHLLCHLLTVILAIIMIFTHFLVCAWIFFCCGYEMTDI